MDPDMKAANSGHNEEPTNPLEVLEEHINGSCWQEAVDTIEKHLTYFTACEKDVFAGKDRNFIAKLFYAAIDHNSEDTIDVLIQHGCDINHGIAMRFRPHIRSPLYHAAKHGNLNIVKKLLDAGCEKNILNNTGSTALYEAAFEGQTEILRLLLESGCDPNIPDCYGKTPIHILPFSNGDNDTKKTCVELLLKHGADISIQCHCGQTALDLAIQYKFVLTLRYLMDNTQALGIRRFPHCPKVLGERILPELLLRTQCTAGFHTVGLILLQLHTCHDITWHTMDEFIRIYFTEIPKYPDLDFYLDARNFYKLMLLSGIRNIPTKKTLSLQESSRIAIRRHLREECWYLCTHLPVPTGIQDYLQLKDIIPTDPD